MSSRVGVPAADRIALLSIWFHGHNNPRYAELLPRLDRLDACLLRLPDSRIPRGLGFRAFTRDQAAAPDRRARPCRLALPEPSLPRLRPATPMARRRSDGRRRPDVLAARDRADAEPRRSCLRRHRRDRGTPIRVARCHEAVDRHPAGREPRRRHPRAASGGCGPQAGGRGGTRLDGGASPDGRRHAAPTIRSTTSTTCSSSGRRSASACRTPGSGSSAGRASGCGPVWPAATMCCSWAVCRVTRRSPPRPRSTSRRTPARPTRASGPRRCPSSSASASRRCRTTTR